MSKVCFISIGNIYITPYINIYIDNLQKKYDIVYWNRDGIEENSRAEKLYPFKHSINNVLHKVIGYFKFSKFCKNILKKNNYDLIVFLGTIPCILNGINIRRFNLKYVVDVRDYTLEKNILFRLIEKYCFELSSAIVISSPAYRDFLPKTYNYLEIHNIQNIDYTRYNKIKNQNNLINISYIGTIAYLEENKKVIDYFANDNRFVLSFIGTNSEILSKYCADNQISNVICKGRFSPNDIMKYYADTDVILNAYGNNNPKLDYALSNKLYFATKLHLPIIVNEGTYMESITKQLGIGLSFGENWDLKQTIIDFEMTKEIEYRLEEFNENVYSKNRESVLVLRSILNEK